MANDETSTTSVPVANRPMTRKHRSQSPSQSLKRNPTDESRISRISTATNRLSSKLPNVLSKANTYVSSSDLTQLKRQNTQYQKESFHSSSVKFERQSTNVNFQTRLPILYSLTNDGDHKRISELRRRQIYALNHLMRELEQEQFRQFCKLHNIGPNNNEHTTNGIEDTNKESS